MQSKLESIGTIKEMNEVDLVNFKEWLGKIAIPCIRCNYSYKVELNTINLVELSDKEHIELTGCPFRFKTHDIIACSNPNCSAVFSYPETTYNRVYLQLLNNNITKTD